MQDGIAPELKSQPRVSQQHLWKESWKADWPWCFCKQPHFPRRGEIQVPTPRVLLQCTPLLALPAAGKALNGGTRSYHPLQMAPLQIIQSQRERKDILEAPGLKPIFTLLLCRSIFIKSFSWYSAQDLCSKARLSTSCKYCSSLHWLPTHTSWKNWRKLLIPYLSLRRTRDWWQNKQAANRHSAASRLK